MSEMLVDCTEGARARERGACDLNRTYPAWLDQYVDVAGETAAERDDRSADEFRAVRESQQQFNQQTRKFYQTRDRYREARRNGNTTEARRQARKLRQQHEEINRTGVRLESSYRTIAANASSNFTEAIRTVREIRANVSNVTEAVTTATFVETSLTAATDHGDISFADPLNATGQLRAANGSPIANREIRLAIGEQVLRTRTDDNGRFAVRYRPTTVPLNASNVTVTYRPLDEAVYLTSSAEIPVSVGQVTPTITLTRSPVTVGFRDSLVVAGRVAHAGIGTPSVPVAVSVGGVNLGTVRTNTSGRYRAVVDLPASIPSGTADVTAAVALEERALAPASTSRGLQVRKTRTTLTLAGDQVGPRRIRVAGTLSTSAGSPPVGERIVLSVDGERVGTARTGEDGTYSETVAVPDAVPAEATAPITARYAPTESNLESTAATDRVHLVPPERPGDRGLLSRVAIPTLSDTAAFLSDTLWDVPVWWWLAGLGAMILVLGLGYALWRRWRREPTPTGEGPDRSADVIEESAVATGDDEPADADAATLLRAARARIEDGDPDGAVIAGYAAMRRRLADRFDMGGPLTHLEFLRSYEANGIEEASLAILRDLTMTYERAAFGRRSVEPAAARQWLADAEELLDRDSATEPI